MPLSFRSGQSPMFPSTESLVPDENGLVGLGGDLAPKTLLEAYQKGIFPWEGRHPVPWFSPDPRLILHPQDVRVPKEVRKSSTSWEFRFNQQFRNVMLRCATVPRPKQTGTWITQSMLGAYVELHYRGWAHSVEVYDNQKLIGGLYGLAIGRAFFGESMFHLVPNASKAALAHLCMYLVQHKFHFIDCQQDTPHLRRMGAQGVPRIDYLERLHKALEPPTKWVLESPNVGISRL